ncbi:MAG TPA: citrate synthase [Victivallales bacterium]|nr:citrate synthase [Victivallales bacterium]HRU00530.1 citrate synthase [Victivallales bacterium]
MEGVFFKKGEAELHLPEKKIKMPIYEGSEGEKAIDISSLRKETGHITYDPGFMNTGSCESVITFIDGEKGILRHRGYDIQDLAENCLFLEVAYLLIHGKLPNKEEYNFFSKLMNQHSMIHEDMQTFFRNYPEGAHPMAVLSAMVVSLSSFYPELEKDTGEDVDITVTRLLSKLRTIAAFSYKKSIGEPFVYPSHKYTYCENFLNMMFWSPVKDYKPDPVAVRALNLYLTIHADHEQNCSTSVVRSVGSAGSNLYASISAGICALWGPLHGGANEAVVNMLENAIKNKIKPEELIKMAKDKNSKFRLMGFGHRIYKSYDPRAKIAKRTCKELLEKFGHGSEPIFDYAMELEEKALKDQYFVDRGLYPNVDFYTGIGYRAMGIPTNMFTVLFALGRLPGWIAQWLEQKNSKVQKIGRPRQLYTGPTQKKFLPMDKR